MTERGALVRIEMVAGQLAASHPADGMDKVPMEQILKPVLVRVVCVGTTVEVVSRRILTALFITSVLSKHSVHVEQRVEEHLHDNPPC